MKFILNVLAQMGVFSLAGFVLYLIFALNPVLGIASLLLFIYIVDKLFG
jgi:hypothetical protein